jgi:two-component system nitrogen regulation response regulator NtrX
VRQILIVDDEKNIRAQLSGLLADEGYGAVAADSAEKGLELLREDRPDLVLLDVMLPGMSGLDLLARIREGDAELPVVLMSGQASIETAVRATKLGAFDYLEKPLDPGRLLLTVRNALETRRLRAANRELSAAAARELIGSSPAMVALRAALDRAAASGARVLITGENGTGKELAARALHAGSPRAAGPFVKVNCAAIPKDLIESELFGHEKGAFTGATARRIGKVEAADGGTLLLDEVGDMAPEAQAKLLRVLEENEVERVGGGKAITVDVRVLAATNQDLARAIAEGRFREDLFYRLNVVPVRMPALRERPGDIPELVERFRADFAHETGRAAPELDGGALAALRAWSWPGNVRELRNVIERLSIMTDGDRVTEGEARAVLGEARPGAATAEPPPDLPLRELLEQTERLAIERALAAAGGTVSEAARALGLDRANLHRKMRRLGIGRPGEAGDETDEGDGEEDVAGDGLGGRGASGEDGPGGRGGSGAAGVSR